jgi:hypothetical protein
MVKMMYVPNTIEVPTHGVDLWYHELRIDCKKFDLLWYSDYIVNAIESVSLSIFYDVFWTNSLIKTS